MHYLQSWLLVKISQSPCNPLTNIYPCGPVQVYPLSIMTWKTKKEHEKKDYAALNTIKLQFRSFVYEAFTKKCSSKTIVLHVFIYKQQLIPFDATTIKFHKIWMLQSRNHSYFINKFTTPLLRFGRELLNSNDNTIWQHTLPFNNLVSVL